MTTEQKVERVETTWRAYGLGPVLAAVDLPKSTWYYHRNQKVAYEDKYAYLFPDLEEIAREHAEYGYRRTTVELRDAYGRTVNHKVVQRLHRIWDFRLQRHIRKPKPSGVRQAIICQWERGQSGGPIGPN